MQNIETIIISIRDPLYISNIHEASRILVWSCLVLQMDVQIVQRNMTHENIASLATCFVQKNADIQIFPQMYTLKSLGACSN